MIIDTGNIIIDRVKTLPWIDKYAGVVKPVSYIEEVKEGQSIKKTFPVACNLDYEQCVNGKNHKDLCPDSSKKSVLYLEDKGIRFLKRESDLFFFQAAFDLVCWLNLLKLGKQQCSISSLVIMSLLNELPIVPFNSGIYQRVMINPLGQASKSANPFIKYSYDIETHQLLLYPYDYFVMPMNVQFAVNRRCINELVLEEPIPCVN